jgi:predicted dehydrogenase
VKPSADALRVGIVGLGIGRHHLRAYQQIPGVEVVAAADVDAERLQAVAGASGVPHLYEDYAPLVANEDVDAVSVCTPNYLHAPVTIAALEHGKHVLCEKPLARTVEEGRAMVAAAREAGRVLKVVFNHRERGDVQVLKRAIEAGTLGRIYHAKAWWLRRNGIPGLGSWFTSREMAGGGPLIDLGVHMLDMALYLLGEPRTRSVSAVTYAELGTRGRGGNVRAQKMAASDRYEVEDLASVFLRLEDNASLILETSWATYRANNDEFGVTLYGTEGGAEIRVVNYVQGDTLTVYTDLVGVPSDIQPHVGKGEGHLAVVRDFVDIVRGSNWGAYTGEEGLYRTQILEASYRSAREGREVAFDTVRA